MAFIEPSIFWHNQDTNETQIWFMSGNRLVRRGTVVDEHGQFTPVGLPFSIVGVGDMDGDGKSDIVWHNQDTGETQIWFMNGERRVRRGTVVDEHGQFTPVGLPFSIVGAGDMDGDGKSDIVWHNQDTGETQIWFMNGERRVRRGTVVDEHGQFTPVGLPFSIVGAGDMDGDGKSDIVWHNQDTGETQIWFMNGERRVRRGTVVDEHGQFTPVGLPFSIVGVGDMDGDGKSDIVWHNKDTGETQIWFMNGERLVRRGTVVDEHGQFIPVGLPFSIVGAASGNLPRLRLVAGLPVRAVQLMRGSDDKIVFTDDTFFSPSNLCGLVLRPTPGVTPIDQRIRSRVADKVNQSPFKMRSDSSVQISGNCDAHAELMATGSSNVRIIIKLPQNRLNLILTTPDVGPVGLPGSLDPRVNITFDLELHTNIIVPPVSGQPLRSEGAGGSTSNTKIVDQNLTAGAAEVVNDLIVFFGGSGFLQGVTDNQTFELSDLGNFLGRFNSQLGSLPVGVPFVPLYDRNSGTLILRLAP